MNKTTYFSSACLLTKTEYLILLFFLKKRSQHGVARVPQKSAIASCPYLSNQSSDLPSFFLHNARVMNLSPKFRKCEFYHGEKQSERTGFERLTQQRKDITKRFTKSKYASRKCRHTSFAADDHGGFSSFNELTA